jgi:hypothetical protein
MTVQMNLQNATLTPLTTTAITPDTGTHPSEPRWLPDLDERRTRCRWSTSGNVAPGRHTLTADFVAADHLPFDPPVTTSVTFERTSG